MHDMLEGADHCAINQLFTLIRRHRSRAVDFPSLATSFFFDFTRSDILNKSWSIEVNFWTTTPFRHLHACEQYWAVQLSLVAQYTYDIGC